MMGACPAYQIVGTLGIVASVDCGSHTGWNLPYLSRISHYISYVKFEMNMENSILITGVIPPMATHLSVSPI